jgi:hypothetical protein
MKLFIFVVLALVAAVVVEAKVGLTETQFKALNQVQKRLYLDAAGGKSELRMIGINGGALPKELQGDAAIVRGISYDEIIDIAAKAWKVIEDNAPSVDLKTSFATGTPNGITDWQMMDGWSDPKFVQYSFTHKAPLGITTVDMEFSVVWSYGGSVDGIGKYVTGAGFEITSLNVAWGYTYECDNSVDSLTNIGTHTAPVAGVLMNLHHTITTKVSHIESNGGFFVDGEGNIEQK